MSSVRIEGFNPKMKEGLIKFFSKLSKESRISLSAGGIEPYSLYKAFEFGWRKNPTRVIIEGNKIVGLVRLEPDCEVGVLAGIVVSDRKRRQQFGSILLRQALTQAFLMGIKQINLRVKKGNVAAEALYRKFGFVVRKEDEDYYYMRKVLQ